MKKGTIIIGLLLLIFLANIIFYIRSEEYRFFLKKIKDPEEIIYDNNTEISDEPELPVFPNDIEIIQANPNKKVEDLLDFGMEEEIHEIVLGPRYQKILDLFSKYKLGKLKLYSSLFDITEEYPDDYIEYYSRDLTLYFFPTKSYKEIYDIFQIQKKLPIELNEVNNFGDSSFYINIKEEDTSNYTDDTVKIIIEHENVIFGLKIKKDEYNEVKKILKQLKK